MLRSSGHGFENGSDLINVVEDVGVLGRIAHSEMRVDDGVADWWTADGRSSYAVGAGEGPAGVAADGRYHGRAVGLMGEDGDDVRGVGRSAVPERPPTPKAVHEGWVVSVREEEHDGAEAPGRCVVPDLHCSSCRVGLHQHPACFARAGQAITTAAVREGDG